MREIEQIDLTAGNLTIDETQFAGDNTFAITADGDSFRVDVDTATGGTIDASGVTIATSSTAVLTYSGSAGTDGLTGGVAAETFLMTAGADSIEGGTTGTDTITLTATGLDVDGTATGDASTGVAINLGATAVDEATVLGAVTRHMGEGTTQVGVGKATFLFTAANATTVGQVNADVVQTIGSIENINGGSGNDYIVATSGNNVVNGGDGVDYISMGDGNDTLLVTAITDIENATNNAIEDTVVGGNGTDKIAFNGGVTLLAAHDFTDNVTGFTEVISNGAQTGAISLTTHATFVSDTGIATIDLSADTSTTGTNVINISNQTTTTAMSLRGGAGIDQFTLDAGSVDTVIVNKSGETGTTGATADTIAGFVTTADKLDFNIAAGTGANFANGNGAGGASDAIGLAAGLTAANTAMNSTIIYFFYDNTTGAADNGYLYFDNNADGTADGAVVITGATASTFVVAGDIIA
jgi:hypothetical protein